MAKRGIGQAELEWNSKASYEWQLHDMSAASGRVHFALFNTRKNLYLVEQLKAGMDLGWYGEAPLSFSLSLNAQQITQGWVPYLGKFPIFGSAGGILLSVANAGSQGVTLMFLKPGTNTSQCSNWAATASCAGDRDDRATDENYLWRGHSCPADQFFGLRRGPPSGTIIPLTFINITYRLN